MVRKNKEQYSSVGLSKETIKKLKDYKIHPNQSMEEVIKKFINKKEVAKNATKNQEVVE